MISVSREWKEALGCIDIPVRNDIAPECFIKITYEQNDPSAQEDATASASGQMPWSDVEDITDLDISYESAPLLASLERNMWELDGESEIIPTDPDMGFVGSAVSLADGSFTANPLITISFSSVQTKSIGGLRITWSTICNEFASQFVIKAYSGASLVANSGTINNSAVSGNYECPMSGYDKITIEIVKWCLPYRRPRMESVAMGFVMNFTKSNFLTFAMGMTGDLMSLTLPDAYVKIDIDNADQAWNPDNPTGMYEFFTERQKVAVYCQYDLGSGQTSDGWVLMGTYYTSEWNTPQNGISASFTARSLLDFMDRKFDPSDIPSYSHGDSISMRSLAYYALVQSNLPTDANGAVKWDIAAIPNDDMVVIPYTASEEGGITSYEYAFDHTCAEVLQLVANACGLIIRFAPDGDIIFERLILDAKDYFIDQSVTLSYGEYDMAKPLYKVEVNDFTPVVKGNTNGEIQSISNEIIQDQTKATEIGSLIGEYLLRRKTIGGSWRADPRLTPYDYIKVENKYAINAVYITSCEYSFSGAWRGSYEGRVMATINKADLDSHLYAGDLYSNEYGG